MRLRILFILFPPPSLPLPFHPVSRLRRVNERFTSFYRLARKNALLKRGVVVFGEISTIGQPHEIAKHASLFFFFFRPAICPTRTRNLSPNREIIVRICSRAGEDGTEKKSLHSCFACSCFLFLFFLPIHYSQNYRTMDSVRQRSGLLLLVPFLALTELAVRLRN